MPKPKTVVINPYCPDQRDCDQHAELKRGLSSYRSKEPFRSSVVVDKNEKRFVFRTGSEKIILMLAAMGQDGRRDFAQMLAEAFIPDDEVEEVLFHTRSDKSEGFYVTVSSRTDDRMIFHLSY